MDSGDLRILVEQHGSERYIAERVTRLRAKRGWSQDELVKQMRAFGCIIPQSAISKLEKPPQSGRRAVTVDEAIGFSKVFGVTLEELLLPPDIVERMQWHQDLVSGAHRWQMHETSRIEYQLLVERQVQAMGEDADWAAHVRDLFREAEGNAPRDGEHDWGRTGRIEFLRDLVTRFDEEAGS